MSRLTVSKLVQYLLEKIEGRSFHINVGTGIDADIDMEGTSLREVLVDVGLKEKKDALNAISLKGLLEFKRYPYFKEEELLRIIAEGFLLLEEKRNKKLIEEFERNRRNLFERNYCSLDVWQIVLSEFGIQSRITKKLKVIVEKVDLTKLFEMHYKCKINNSGDIFDIKNIKRPTSVIMEDEELFFIKDECTLETIYLGKCTADKIHIASLAVDFATFLTSKDIYPEPYNSSQNTQL